jgi:hypothetical protein
MAKAQALRKPGSARKGGKSKTYVMIALALPVAIIMLPSAIVLAAAMVPTMVAWVIDPKGKRFLMATVGAMNFAGSLFFLVLLWADIPDLQHALHVLRNIYGWLIAYGAAAVGYGVHFMMPRATESIVRYRAASRLGKLEKHMKEMVDEWGAAVGEPRRE